MIKVKELIIVISIIVLINVTFVSAITGSMGNAKMILYPDVNGFTTTTIEKSILTKNVNDVPINVTLRIDEESKEFLELIDESFILFAGENKKAKFLVKVRKEGTYNGRINVFFSPIDSKDPGVVLSSTIIVVAKKDQGYEEIEEETEVDNKKVNAGKTENKKGSVNVFTGNAVSNQEPVKSENAGLWKGFFFGASLILIIALAGLIYFILKKSKKKIKRRKRRVKKSGGKKKRKRKKK